MTNSSETKSPESTHVETAQEAPHTADKPVSAGTEMDHARSNDIEETASLAAPGLTRKRMVTYGLLLALTLAAVAGAVFTVWRSSADQYARTAAVAAVGAATETTISMLSYTPENSAKDLPAAADRLAEPFRGQYTKLINDVVIPGSQQKKISAVATVPAAASASATGDSAVVLLFVNQTINIGSDAPSATASCVRVTLAKVHDRWLISQFEPV